MNHTITILEGECDLTDEAAAEYDFADLHKRAAEQGREYRGILSGLLVRLDPELSAFFKTPEAALEALRRVMQDAQRAA